MRITDLKDHCCRGARFMLELAPALREAVGPDFALMHDPVVRYDHREVLLAGRPRPYAYPFGAGEAFDAVCFVGQHAKSNAVGGHLAHTGAFAVEELTINGVSVGELGSTLRADGPGGGPARTARVTGDDLLAVLQAPRQHVAAP